MDFSAPVRKRNHGPGEPGHGSSTASNHNGALSIEPEKMSYFMNPHPARSQNTGSEKALTLAQDEE